MNRTTRGGPVVHVIREGAFYIDIPGHDGTIIESILFLAGSSIDLPSRKVGVHYYAMYDFPPPRVGVRIYRRTVTSARSQDHMWSVRDNGWIRTAWLLPYAVGRCDEPLRAISERAALHIIEMTQAYFDADPW